MSDLVSRVLAAIEQTEKNAEAATHMRWVFQQARRSGHTVMQEFFTRHDPAAVLRRCAADRAIVEWCAEVIGDRDLSNYGEFGSLKDDPQSLAITLAVETLRVLAAGYGISAEEGDA